MAAGWQEALCCAWRACLVLDKSWCLLGVKTEQSFGNDGHDGSWWFINSSKQVVCLASLMVNSCGWSGFLWVSSMCGWAVLPMSTPRLAPGEYGRRTPWNQLSCFLEPAPALLCWKLGLHGLTSPVNLRRIYHSLAGLYTWRMRF